MAVKVKICGLRTAATLDAALAAGADFVGLVHYPPSPRSVDLTAAAELAGRARGRAQIVMLLVDPDDDLVDRVIATVAPDMLQLHGHETPERVAALAARTGRPILKAVAVAGPGDAEAARAYRPAADLILFDAKPPKGVAGALPGGNGVAFDWRLLDGVRDLGPFVLSGGLTPSNVAEAIALTGAPIVDVSSGVERRPGEKDPELIGRFIEAARSAASRPKPAADAGAGARHRP